MEQFDHKYLTGDSPSRPAGVLAFDVLRTIIAARQAASPTARVLAGQSVSSSAAPSGRDAEALITLFTRRGATAESGSFARDEAVIRQDERHA